MVDNVIIVLQVSPLRFELDCCVLRLYCVLSALLICLFRHLCQLTAQQCKRIQLVSNLPEVIPSALRVQRFKYLVRAGR